jgi:hypothetical protein
MRWWYDIGTIDTKSEDKILDRKVEETSWEANETVWMK